MARPILPVVSVADRISAVVLLGVLLVVAVDVKVCGNKIISFPGPDLPSRSSAPPSSSRLQDSGSSAPPPPKLVLAPSPINAARFSRSRQQAVGEFRKTRHPRNIEFNKVLEICFPGPQTCGFQESWTCEASGSRICDFRESWTCEDSELRTCEFRESWICEASGSRTCDLRES
jgi:hypothetical protein